MNKYYSREKAEKGPHIQSIEFVGKEISLTFPKETPNDGWKLYPLVPPTVSLNYKLHL